MGKIDDFYDEPPLFIYEIKEKKKKDFNRYKGKTIYCLTCSTDIRPQNKKYHEDLNHRVAIYDYDRRLKKT